MLRSLVGSEMCIRDRHHPSPFASTAITVDASGIAVGGELSQRGSDASWRPLAFYSHALSKAEQKYSAFDRELLAVFLAIKHFRHYLEGRKFTVFTDHRPLTHALTTSTLRSPRQTRHLSFIAEFTSDIRYIRGERNVVADALSRPSTPLISSVSGPAVPNIPAVNFEKMATEQDPSQVLGMSLNLRKVHWNGYSLWCDTEHGRIRPLVPAKYRRLIFQSLHGLSHPGTRPALKLVTSRFVWPGVRSDIRAWCKTCPSCQSAKIGSCLLYTSPSPRDS